MRSLDCRAENFPTLSIFLTWRNKLIYRQVYVRKLRMRLEIEKCGAFNHWLKGAYLWQDFANLLWRTTKAVSKINHSNVKISSSDVTFCKLLYDCFSMIKVKYSHKSWQRLSTPIVNIDSFVKIFFRRKFFSRNILFLKKTILLENNTWRKHRCRLSPSSTH